MLDHAQVPLINERKRRRPLLLMLVLLLAVAVAVVEVTSFVRLISVTAVAPLTPDQQLAQAQSAVRFPIHQPTWLPGLAALESITYHARCASCSEPNSVTLIYGAATPGIDIEIYEADGPVTFQVGYEDSQGHAQSMQDATSIITLNGISLQVDTLTGTMSNGPIREVVLTWTRDGIYYKLTSRDSPSYVANLDVLERIAEST